MIAHFLTMRLCFNEEGYNPLYPEGVICLGFQCRRQRAKPLPRNAEAAKKVAVLHGQFLSKLRNSAFRALQCRSAPAV
jgi:hypothetical protein